MRFLLTAALCWLFLGLLVAPGNAQNIEPSRPFSHIVADWNATFERVEKYRAPKRLLDHSRLRWARVIVKHIVRPQQQRNVYCTRQVEILDLPRIDDP